MVHPISSPSDLQIRSTGLRYIDERVNYSKILFSQTKQIYFQNKYVILMKFALINLAITSRIKETQNILIESMILPST